MKSNKIDFFSSPANNNIGFQQVEDPPKDQNFNHYSHHFDDYKTPKREAQFRFSPLYHNRTELVQNQFLDDPQSYFMTHKKDQMRTQKRPYKIGRKISFNQKQEDQQFLSVQQQMNQIKKIPVQKKILQKQQDFFNKNLRNYDFYTPSKKNNRKQNLTLDYSEKSLKGCEKGLRRLSFLSFQIVNQLGSTSYKEVAQRLLQKLNITQQFDLDEQRQDRSGMRNIKRRVYDSLNVLIALGVLVRNGNKIIRNKPKKQLLLNQDEKVKKTAMQSQLKNKQFTLLHKKKIFQQLKAKVAMLNKILQRNKILIQKQKIAQFEGQKISFPFIVIVSEEAQQEGNIKLQSLVQTKKKDNNNNNSKNQNSPNISSVNLDFKYQVEVFGDLDSMPHLLNHHNQSKIQQYLSDQSTYHRANHQKSTILRQNALQKFTYFHEENINEQNQNEEQSQKMKEQQYSNSQNEIIAEQQNQHKRNNEIQMFPQQEKQYVDPQKLIDQVFNHSPQQDQ